MEIQNKLIIASLFCNILQNVVNIDFDNVSKLEFHFQIEKIVENENNSKFRIDNKFMINNEIKESSQSFIDNHNKIPDDLEILKQVNLDFSNFFETKNQIENNIESDDSDYDFDSETEKSIKENFRLRAKYQKLNDEELEVELNELLNELNEEYINYDKNFESLELSLEGDLRCVNFQRKSEIYELYFKILNKLVNNLKDDKLIVSLMTNYNCIKSKINCTDDLKQKIKEFIVQFIEKKIENNKYEILSHLIMFAAEEFESNFIHKIRSMNCNEKNKEQLIEFISNKIKIINEQDRNETRKLQKRNHELMRLNEKLKF